MPRDDRSGRLARWNDRSGDARDAVAEQRADLDVSARTLYAEAADYFQPALELTPDRYRPVVEHLVRRFAEALAGDVEFRNAVASLRDFGAAVETTRRTREF